MHCCRFLAMSRRLIPLLLLVPAWLMLSGLLKQPLPALSQPKAMEPPAKSPQESLKSIKTRPGFTVDLVASEPLVMDPIAFAWGPDGKFWVVEMGDYPLGVDGKGKHGGNIKYLEDTDGDGKYDKATLFLANLGYPSGVLPWKKGVLVTCAPDIFYAEDTDGDGKADKKEVLYTGFKEGNQQHRVNSLVWGLDGWIYVANGDSGGGIKSLKTGKTINISGRDLRIKPDAGLIEAQSGQTQFGRAKDDWDNWFGNNNSNPMFHFVLADHYLKRNPYYAPPSPKVQVSVKPGASPVYPISPPLPRFNDFHTLNHFTSACSAIVYRDNLFYKPEAQATEKPGANASGSESLFYKPEAQGTGKPGANASGSESFVFISEPVHNLVHREIMQPKGVTFTSQRAPDEQQSEFLASSDNWFRPAMIQTGPDGALWIADMYRYVIEHPQWIPIDWQKKLDLRAGHDMGRIYKVYPVGKKPRAIPRLDKLDTAGLVAALDSPSGWQRDMVQMMLVWKQDAASIPLLEKMAQNSKRPLARVHALCTLHCMKALGTALLRKAVSDPHPGVRKHAVRMSEDYYKDPQGGPVGLDLAKLVNDPDVHVRMQLAYTIGELPGFKAGYWLGELALKDGNDPYFLAAVLSSFNIKTSPGVLMTVLSSKKENAAPLVETLLGIAERQGDTKATGSLLHWIAHSKGGQNDSWKFTALATLLDSLDAKNSSLSKMHQHGDAELKDVINNLSGIFDTARKIVTDSEASTAQKIQAIKLLGRGLDKQKEDSETLAKLLAPQVPSNVQLATVSTLGKLREPAVLPLLLKGWKSYSPPVRSQVMDVLLSRPEGVQTTLKALEQKQILPLEMELTQQQRLLQHKSEAIRKEAAKLFAGTVNADRQKVIAVYLKALTAKGDATRGKVVFEKSCATCHFLGGIGQKVGPDLSSLSGKTGEYLLRSILDPNQAVEARYLNYTAITKNGVSHSGLLASETATSITLVSQDGKQQTLLRTDLDELYSSGKSAMPEGVEKDINAAQMSDLLAFLQSNLPAAKHKSFPGNNPGIIRPDKTGIFVLPANKAEIYGPSLIFEGKYSNLGYWSHTDDLAVWNIEVSKAGKYAVWFDWAMIPGSAGNTFILEAADAKLTGKVQSTGSWDKYRQAKVGEISLPVGRMPLSMRSVGKISGALIDLKSIKLVPLGG